MSNDDSYVIAVSLPSRCYFHIQISGNTTLLAFSNFILETFKFANDHLHAFFMDNHTFSNNDCYYSSLSDDDEPNQKLSSDYKLNQLGLTQGMKFKYLFDFGDMWTFQCKVLRILKTDTPNPIVIKSHGKPPSQYGDYDDEKDKEEEEDSSEKNNDKKEDNQKNNDKNDK